MQFNHILHLYLIDEIMQLFFKMHARVCVRVCMHAIYIFNDIIFGVIHFLVGIESFDLVQLSN